MEKAPFGHRQKDRQQQQQQPQQSAVFQMAAGFTERQMGSEHPRQSWQMLAMQQARRQSGGEL
jgi:hypothetical protein